MSDAATVPNRFGELKRHPAYATLREMMAEARRLAAELGLTPASRSKVGMPDDEQEDDTASALGL